MKVVERHITESLVAALCDTPVVLLQGARQSGKSTLVRWLSERKPKASYFTLDDAAVLAAATRDPDTFIRAASGPIVIDEVQLAPDLFRAIKLEVDNRRTPGRFLLTGSTNIMLLPKLSESLAGRMEVLTLWPFSFGELHGVREGFVDRLFESDDFAGLTHRALVGKELLKRLLIGGYPEVAQRPDAARRRAWFAAFASLNALVVVSTMTTGWHYFADVVSGAVVAAISFWGVQAAAGWIYSPETES